MHELQDKGTAGVEAVQAFRVGVCLLRCRVLWGTFANEWHTEATRRRRVLRWCSRWLYDEGCASSDSYGFMKERCHRGF